MAFQGKGPETMSIASARGLVSRAMTEVQAVDPAEAVNLRGDPGVVLVDVRETAERERHGVVPGAVHAPRGFLEFVLDPESPMHDPALDPSKRLVFFCASGARSALAAKTAKDMGYADVANMVGGFGAWAQFGGPVE